MNTLTPTPTPRTDERKASFALNTIRQLETELTAVTEQRDRLVVQLEALSKPADYIHNGVGIADLYAPGEFEKVENQTSV